MKTIAKPILKKLDPQFLTHLEEEFGDMGKRASVFLGTAQVLLEMNNATIPGTAELVAYSLREAMTSLLETPEELLTLPHAEKTPTIGQLTRKVASAQHKYEETRYNSQQNEEEAYDNFQKSLNELHNFQTEDTDYKKLQNIIEARTSYLPKDKTPALNHFIEVHRELNNQLHTEPTLQEAQAKWSECLKAFEALFMPAAKRISKLESLARIEAPTEDDVRKLRQYVVTATHYRHFFEHLPSLDWLKLLLETDIIDPPTYRPGPPREFWPASYALNNLYRKFPTEIVDLLDTLLKKYKNEHERIWHITLCAFHIGADALPIVLKAVLDFPARPEIVELGYWASAKAEPASDLLTTLFDKLVSPNPPRFIEDSMSLHNNTKLIEAFAEGTTESNYAKRTELICYKLKGVPENNRTRRRLEHFQGGSVSDYRATEDEVSVRRTDYNGFFSVLLNGLLTILDKSQSWTTAEALIESLSELPPFLQQRVRAWLLAASDSAQNETRIREIAEAIKSHKVTGDHISLLNRIAKDCENSEFAPIWNAALSDAPNSKKIKEAISENFLPDEWRRELDWVNILTEDSNQNKKLLDNLRQDWELALQKLAKLHLPHNRHNLEFAFKTEYFITTSPFSAEELQKLAPEEAASLIATWQPKVSSQPDREIVQTPHELGAALLSTVQANPNEWSKSPQTILETLCHPTYIHHYLSGIASAINDGNLKPSNQQIAELIDFVETIYSPPQDVEPLGNSQSDYDMNWNKTKRASIELIDVLAASEIGYRNRQDRVWNILKQQIEDRSEPSRMYSDLRLDTFRIAFDRTCTYALLSLLFFSRYEYNKFKILRSETLQILENCLRLSGQDGIECRAIIAPTLDWLEHLAPEWLEHTRDLIFGEQAPDGLAQRTVEQTFSRGQPSDWLFKNYREMIENSVKLHVPESLFYYLVGMLREHEGYSVKEVIDFLDQVPPKAARKLANPAAPWQRETTAISYSGERIGKYLGAVIDPQIHEMARIADCFWRKVLELKEPKHLGGFGWYSEVFSIDDAQWAKRTLETLKLTGGHINGERQVTERALKLEDKKSCLEIVNYLIRVNNSLDTTSRANDYACQALESAQELSDTPEYERLETALRERGLEIMSEDEVSDPD